MTINAGYLELDGDIYIEGDITVENLARINGGIIYVAGEIVDNDGNWHGTGDIQPWVINEAPTDLEFEGGTVNENAPAGTFVAQATVVDVDEGDTHSYELVDDADGRFQIDDNGRITVADGADLDHEAADEHTVTVRVTDAAGETYEEALTIAIADVNEAPTAVTLDANIADENIVRVTIGGERGGGGGSTGAPKYQILVDGEVVKSGTADWMDMSRFSDQDPESRWHELEIAIPGDTAPEQVEVRFTNDSYGGTRDTDRNLYVDSIEVNGKTYEAESSDTDYERSGSTIGGQEGMYWNGKLVFDTTDAPEPMHAVVAENVPGAIVGQLGIVDPDADDDAGYAVSDNRFEVTPDGVLKLRDGVTLDHETEPVVSVEVIGTDSAGNDIDATFRIGVADTNDAPLDLQLTGQIVSENASAGTVVGTVSFTDGDADDTHVLELVDDAGGRFEIDAAGNITVAEGAELDHETGASHEIVVRVTDAEGATIEQAYTIDVTDVNEGIESLSFTGGTVTENASPGTTVASAEVTDPDAGDSFSYELIENADGRFEIDANGNITVAEGADLNHEDASSHTITVRATDSAGHTIERELVIDIADVNETPDELTFTGGSVQENAPIGTIVASANVSDPDAGETFSYELLDNAGGRFVIDGSGNIVLADGSGLDHEAADSHEVTVRATDSAGNTIERTVVIEVTDVNESPVELAFSGGNVPENAAPGTVVATAAVTDVDAGDSHTYELVGDADGRFTIGADGNITVAEGADLNHEAASSHTVTVRATDSAGHTIERELVIDVSDVNEGIESLSFTGGTVDENASAGTVVASASVVDPDADETHTYELVGDADGRFTIDADGNITVAEGADLNHEDASSHTVTVRATDSAGHTIERELVIDVSDVNEGIESLSFTGGTVDENASAGTIVASASVVDPDADETHTYELVGDADGRFTIDADGNITVAEGADLNHEAASSHTVTVRATDSAGHTIERELVIDVSDVNEAPLTLTFSGGDVSEDALGGTVVASASVTDVDQGETFSYQLVDDAGGRFTIDADGNVLVSGDGVLDFETAKSHEITVRVTDSGGHTIERTLTIEITNVNEAVAEEAETEVAEAQQAAGAARVAAYEMRQDTSDPQAEGGDTDRDDAGMDEPYAADTSGDREVPTASETLNWIAAEVEELTELAKSVDTADIQFSDSTTSGGEAAFEDVFVQSNTEDNIEEPRGSTEETPEYERASDGFIGKFWTMLRAGFGTTNKVDESQAAGTHADRGHQSRSRRK